MCIMAQGLERARCEGAGGCEPEGEDDRRFIYLCEPQVRGIFSLSAHHDTDLLSSSNCFVTITSVNHAPAFWDDPNRSSHPVSRGLSFHPSIEMQFREQGGWFSQTTSYHVTLFPLCLTTRAFLRGVRSDHVQPPSESYELVCLHGSVLGSTAAMSTRSAFTRTVHHSFLIQSRTSLRTRNSPASSSASFN